MKQAPINHVRFCILSIIVIMLISTSTPSAQAFLWKPVSESSGNLVILFHNQYRIENVASVHITANGKETKPTSTTQNGANGDRIHCRFNAPGSSFGSNPKVVINLRNGKSVSWTVPSGAKRFETGAGNTSNNNTGNTSINDILGGIGDTSDDSLVSLTAANQGTKEYQVKEDQTIIVSPYLTTYGPAHLSVIVKQSNGKEIIFIEWTRTGDSDPSAAKVNGKEEPGSMFEQNPGDMSAKAGLKYELKVKKNDIVELTLKGDFGNAPGSLKLLNK